MCVLYFFVLSSHILNELEILSHVASTSLLTLKMQYEIHFVLVVFLKWWASQFFFIIIFFLLARLPWLKWFHFCLDVVKRMKPVKSTWHKTICWTSWLWFRFAFCLFLGSCVCKKMTDPPPLIGAGDRFSVMCWTWLFFYLCLRIWNIFVTNEADFSQWECLFRLCWVL